MHLIALYYAAPIFLVAALVMAKSKSDRDAKYSFVIRSHFWGYVLGYSAVFCAALVLFFALPVLVFTPRAEWPPYLLWVALWAGAILITGVLTLRKSRYGTMILVVLSAFPPIWIFGGIYLRNRWQELSMLEPSRER